MAYRCDGGKFPYDAVAFDMDGTLLDSMGYWRRTNSDFLAERGLEAPEEIRADLGETSNRLCARVYAEKLGLQLDEKAILKAFQANMKRYYETVIEPKPRALDYVLHLKAEGVRVCIATASPSHLAIPALERHGLLAPMEFLMSAGDMGISKENPRYYEMVAQRLGLAPERCVMFEDALYAMKAAKEAGMHVYGICDPVQRRDEVAIRAICEVYVEDFAQLLCC